MHSSDRKNERRKKSHDTALYFQSIMGKMMVKYCENMRYADRIILICQVYYINKEEFNKIVDIYYTIGNEWNYFQQTHNVHLSF